jgi:prepilin-type N-terminal cleavage/methylation domain-containing protein
MKKHSKPHQLQTQSGFTLIELAIVLVIVGLLLGGVFKGQELINSAKVKNMVGDFKNVQVFMYAYQDKYHALPGDDALAQNHLGTTASQSASGAGNGVIAGSWDSVSDKDESVLFWQHIRLAGLASGSTTVGGADFYPTNADGGRMGVQSLAGFTPAGLSGAYVACSANVLGKYAKQIDTVLDDGATHLGSVRVYAIDGNAWLPVTGNSAINDATPYNVCMAF